MEDITTTVIIVKLTIKGNGTAEQLAKDVVTALASCSDESNPFTEVMDDPGYNPAYGNFGRTEWRDCLIANAELVGIGPVNIEGTY